MTKTFKKITVQGGRSDWDSQGSRADRVVEWENSRGGVGERGDWGEQVIIILL